MSDKNNGSGKDSQQGDDKNRQAVLVRRPLDPVAQLLRNFHGRSWDGFAEILDFVRTQEPPQRVVMLREINDIIMAHIAQASQYAEKLASLLEEQELAHPEYFNEKNRDYHHAFKDVKLVATTFRKARNRHLNAERNLIKQGFLTREFLDHVIKDLIGGTTAALDALNRARKEKFGLIEILNRASREMIRRLSGERKYNDGRTTLSPLDIDEARKPEHPNFVLSKSHLDRTNKSELLLDEYGIVWNHEPSSEQRELLRQEHRRPRAQLPPPTEAELEATEPKVHDTRYKGTKRGFARDYGEATYDPETKRMKRVPLTAEELSYNRIESILTKIQGLPLTAKPYDPAKSPEHSPIPNPTHTQQLILELLNKKLAALNDRRSIDLSREVIRQFQGMDVQTLLKDLSIIGQAFATSNIKPPTLAAYAQGAFDIGRLILESLQARDANTAQIRRDIAAWRNERLGLNWRLRVRNTRRGLDLNIWDLESYLVDEGHIGWLTGEAIVGALLLDGDPDTEFIIDPHVWTSWVNSGEQPDQLPSIPDDRYRNLVIPVHHGNHWTLIYFHIGERRVFFMDSMFNEERRQEMRRQVRNFLDQTWIGRERPGFEFMEERGGQQLNARDCGLFVIENVVRLRAGNQEPGPINGHASRRNWVHRLQNASHEDYVRQRRTAEQNPAGRTADQPILLDEVDLTPQNLDSLARLNLRSQAQGQAVHRSGSLSSTGMQSGVTAETTHHEIVRRPAGEALPVPDKEARVPSETDMIRDAPEEELFYGGPGPASSTGDRASQDTAAALQMRTSVPATSGPSLLSGPSQPYTFTTTVPGFPPGRYTIPGPPIGLPGPVPAVRPGADERIRIHPGIRRDLQPYVTPRTNFIMMERVNEMPAVLRYYAGRDVGPLPPG